MRIPCWAVVLLVTAPLAAQVDDKAAVAQFKEDTKPLLKDFKSASNELKGVLTDAIEAFEDDLPGAADPVATADTLAEAVQSFHSGLRGLLLDVSLGADTAWQEALAANAGGTPLDGIYPEGLVSGDGGAVDDFRQSVDKQVAKIVSSLNKRLDKAEKSAESDGFGLLAWSGVPGGLNASAASEDLAGGSFPPFSIDIVVSFSDLATGGDGVLWVGGSANSDELPVTVTLTQGLVTRDEAVVPVETNQTWLVPLDGEGKGLPEGNLIVLADVDDAGEIVSAPAGIR